MPNNSYRLDEIGFKKTVKVLAGATETIISKDMIVSNEDSVNFAFFFEVKDFALSGAETIELRLQEQVGCPKIWCDVGEVTCVEVDQDGTYAVKLSLGVELEALVLPLSNPIRAVLRTGGASTMLVTNIFVVRNQ